MKKNVLLKKAVLSFLVIAIISIAACQQVVKKSSGEKKDAAMENKNTTGYAEAEQVGKELSDVNTTGYAEAEQVGKELSDVDSVENDLSADEFSDLDAGLSDVQNI